MLTVQQDSVLTIQLTPLQEGYYYFYITDQELNHRRAKVNAVTQLEHEIISYVLNISIMWREYIKIKFFMATQHRLIFLKEALWRRSCPWIVVFANFHGVNHLSTANLKLPMTHHG